MPCNSDYLSSTHNEREASKIYALLDELDGKPIKNYGSGYDPRVYNKGLGKPFMDTLVRRLCKKLAKVDIVKYSLEMQMWYRDHQKADASWT